MTQQQPSMIELLVHVAMKMGGKTPFLFPLSHFIVEIGSGSRSRTAGSGNGSRLYGCAETNQYGRKLDVNGWKLRTLVRTHIPH